jgi:hypothetical protein
VEVVSAVPGPRIRQTLGIVSSDRRDKAKSRPCFQLVNYETQSFCATMPVILGPEISAINWRRIHILLYGGE